MHNIESRYSMLALVLTRARASRFILILGLHLCPMSYLLLKGLC